MCSWTTSLEFIWRKYFRQNELNLKQPVACASAHAFLHPCHVKNVARDHPTIEAEAEAEVEDQKEQQPEEEYAVVDQVDDQALESNFANPDSQS